MQNTVAAGPYTVKVAKKELPFGNNFVVQKAKVVQYAGQDELACVVLCTADSREPGRKYFVQYSIQGKLQECNTLN